MTMSAAVAGNRLSGIAAAVANGGKMRFVPSMTTSAGSNGTPVSSRSFAWR